MNQDKIHLVNKIFSNEAIRTIWDMEEEKYFISVIDIVSVISESKDGRKYWNKLKQRLKDEGNELVTNCHQLKLKAVVVNNNALNYEYIDEKEIEMK